MNTLLIILAIVTFVSTIIGGLVIIKLRKFLPYFFAFAAGSLVAVSFLEILPESLSIAGGVGFPTRYIFLIVVLSFFVYSLLEKFFLTHHHDLEDSDCKHECKKHHEEDSHGHIMGPIGAGSLVLHSFLDGAAIGAAFQVNAATGLIVALAVIFHDFTDGINTVIMMLKNKQNMKSTITFLILDALAPVAGVLATNLVAIPQKALAIILAVFVGEFIYIGASNFLPEAREHTSKWIIAALALGILLITVLTMIV